LHLTDYAMKHGGLRALKVSHETNAAVGQKVRLTTETSIYYTGCCGS